VHRNRRDAVINIILDLGELSHKNAPRNKNKALNSSCLAEATQGFG
jgi:hypothetical protein